MDIIILSEINIKKEELSFYQIPGYNTNIHTRETIRGGGILIYAKESLNFDAQRVETEAVEMLHGQLKTRENITHIISLYRPPQKNKLLFIEQLETIIRSICASENVIVIGDTNIDILNDVVNPTSTKYKNTLCECGLQCVIPSTEITREAIVDGNPQSSCLDHVWVRAGRNECGSFSFVLETHISDHHAVGLALATSLSNNKLNHALVGLRPWWWHACNVALHAACCALVARACVTIARLQRPFAALAAVLFAVHPVHTEAVAGVVGRADVLACIFFLSSLLVYHRPTSNKKCVWLSVVLGALSMLAKETGIMIFILNLAFDFYRCWPFVKRSICSFKIEKKCTGLSLRTIKVVVSLALLVCLRLALLQGTWPSFSTQDNPAAFHPSFFVRLMTFCYLAAFNWWLLLCPWTLSHDWQMGSVPLITSGWDPRNLLTCAAFGALLLLCYRFIADLEVQKHTPAVIGLLLMVLPFVPASNLLVTVGFVIAERVLYIPSVGSVIITAYGVQLMWCSKPGTKVFLAVGLAVLAASGVARTHRRNAEWRDRATLLRADLVTLPQNAKLHYNLANFLRETEQQDSAIKHYKEALRLWPSYASAHNNIGTLVSGMDNAEHHFLQAIKFNKYHVNAHYNLGKLYKKSGRMHQAISMLEKCIWLQPRFVQAHVELLTLKTENEKQGILMRLVDLEPSNWEHYILYGDWLRSRGLPAPAAKYYLEATRLSFRYRGAERNVRADLISFRYTALMYRSLGQKSRTLQLLTRWHTWRRGWPSAAAAHMYLRDWRLKMELEGRAQLYSKAVNPTKSTKCFDHTQLAVSSKEERIPRKEDKNKTVDTKSASKMSSDKKGSDNRSCGTKKRNLSVSSQIKTTHNKSEIGLKDKKCTLHRKDKKKGNGVIATIGTPLAEHILMKTY